MLVLKKHVSDLGKEALILLTHVFVVTKAFILRHGDVRHGKRGVTFTTRRACFTKDSFFHKKRRSPRKEASVFHKEAFATNGGLSFTRGGVRFGKRGVRNGIIRRGEGTTTRDHEEKKHKAKKERRKNGKHKEKKYRPYVQQERTRRKHRTKKQKKGARRKGKIGVRPVKIYTKYEYDE